MVLPDNPYNWTSSHEAALCISLIDNHMKLRMKPFGVGFTWDYYTYDSLRFHIACFLQKYDECYRPGNMVYCTKHAICENSKRKCILLHVTITYAIPLKQHVSMYLFSYSMSYTELLKSSSFLLNICSIYNLWANCVPRH